MSQSPVGFSTEPDRHILLRGLRKMSQSPVVLFGALNHFGNAEMGLRLIADFVMATTNQSDCDRSVQF